MQGEKKKKLLLLFIQIISCGKSCQRYGNERQDVHHYIHVVNKIVLKYN